ncbi:MAG: hypothetical protein ABIH37_02645 [archaeon]
MKTFDKKLLNTKPLSERVSKSDLSLILDINTKPPEINQEHLEKIKHLAKEIINSRKNNKPVIITFGAHLIKSGLSIIIRKMIEKKYITHLATNGAGSIHDWELSFLGKTEEDVRKYVQEGQFGLWEETGKYINLAIINGAKNNLGYGESVGKLIHTENLDYQCISHPNKQYSMQESAFSNNIPFTVHPCLGQDIIHTHPLCSFEAIGKTAEVDFLRFVNSVSNLEGGIYLSVGSAIMSPMIFEKALSMARNIAHQNNKTITNFMIVVNDIQNSGDWDWTSNIDPPKTSPAYYLRFCKTFHRMGAREMHYLQMNNSAFLLNLFSELNKLDNSNQNAYL